MKDEIVIISPELNPGGGGLADYTLRVLEHWADQKDLRFVIPESAVIPQGTEKRIDRIANREDALRDRLPAAGGKVFLQYSAYGYSHVGYPRWLLRALTGWKKNSAGLLVIMFHEIWTFWPLLNKNYFVQRLHRSALRKLVAVADAIFTSTPSQAEHLSVLIPGSSIQVMPVGSNIRRISTAEPAREDGMAVLFGLQRARNRALREIHSDLKSLASKGLITKLITVGKANTRDDEAEESRLLLELNLAHGFEQRGALPEAEVSMLLSRAGFGISAQDGLSFTKSGVFMAYAAHELNILSPYGDPLGPEPLCWLTHPSELLRGLSADELKSRAQNLCAWQERTASWPYIAQRFAEALQLNHHAG
ncbi:MAG: hypothetical protein ABR589_08410 [Chthoniobacterales bacterium]